MKPDASSANRLTCTGTLADSIGFDLLPDQLGREIESALKSVLAGGGVFPVGIDPLSIFRNTLRTSIRDIETHERGQLFQRFLRDGVYEGEGEIPPELPDRRLDEADTAAAITFIYSSMVNSFKGAVTELLAAATCHRLMREFQLADKLPGAARLYVGDAVMLPCKSRKGVLKGADLHILVVDAEESEAPRVTVAGVVEVKSGPKSAGAMGGQLEKHIYRVRQGLRVNSMYYAGEQVRIGLGPHACILRITVQPSDWPLPRTLHFDVTTGTRQLTVDPPIPPMDDDQAIPLGDDRWHVSLRWSQEAIAAAAYEMTFWYMEKVGEIIYTKKGDEPDPKPKEWEEMTPAEAGQNAVKMMLYYAIRPYAIKDQKGSLSKREARIMQKAIALYNTYGFGYALGMNFRNKAGRREMLWPQDLDEIATNGCNKDGCRIV